MYSLQKTGEKLKENQINLWRDEENTFILKNEPLDCITYLKTFLRHSLFYWKAAKVRKAVQSPLIRDWKGKVVSSVNEQTEQAAHHYFL